MKINIAICDDEPLQVQINSRYLKELGELNNYELTIHGFTSLPALQKHMESNPVDILFMDIDLGEASGIRGAIDLYKSAPELIVIFITAHREFAYDAFDMEATGYILKPVDPAKLEHILNKAVILVKNRSKEPVAKFHTFMVDKNNMRIADSSILYAERVLSHVELTTTNGTYRIYESLTSLSEKLGDGFIRISQSVLMRISEIQDIKGFVLYTKHGEEKTISRKVRKDVLQAFFEQ